MSAVVTFPRASSFMNMHRAYWGPYVLTAVLWRPLFWGEYHTHHLPVCTSSHILTCMTLPQTFPSFLLVLLCKPCVSQAGCSLLPTSLCIFLLDLLHNFSISFAHNRENQLSHLKSALWQVCHGLPRQSASQWSQGCASTVTLGGEPGRPMGVAACTLLPCS